MTKTSMFELNIQETLGHLHICMVKLAQEGIFEHQVLASRLTGGAEASAA